MNRSKWAEGRWHARHAMAGQTQLLPGPGLYFDHQCFRGHGGHKPWPSPEACNTGGQEAGEMPKSMAGLETREHRCEDPRPNRRESRPTQQTRHLPASPLRPPARCSLGQTRTAQDELPKSYHDGDDTTEQSLATTQDNTTPRPKTSHPHPAAQEDFLLLDPDII